jgi:hypothetical protein
MTRPDQKLSERREILRATRASARRCGQDPVAIAGRATRGEAEAADDHRRVWLLHRLGASEKILKKLGFEFIENVFYEPTGLMHPS